jgi:hypothetical protein
VLDPRLFDPAAVARAEHAGRLPVLVSYSRGVPGLPGVTITKAGARSASGYLTAAGAAAFGRALARQVAADHARASYGRDGMFAGGVSVRLPGSPAPRIAPRFRMNTVTVTGTDLAGKPDTGDVVFLLNADNADRFDDLLGASLGVFHDGVAKFSAPPGHYWAVGQFLTLHGGASLDVHLVVRPQFTVGSHTTVHLDGRSATSRVQMVTAKPTIVRTTGLTLVRFSGAGPVVGLEWFVQAFHRTVPNGRIWVNPTSRRPSVGSLAVISSMQRVSHGFRGVPYQYLLAYSRNGLIPPQHRVIDQASLATVDGRYYAASKQNLVQSYDPVQLAGTRFCGAVGDLDFSADMPGRRTVYLSPGQRLIWRGSGGRQTDSGRVVSPGEHLTDNWGAFPLHPAPTVQLPGTAGLGPTVVSGARAGNRLGLDWWALSDNQFAHRGDLVVADGSYRLDQNGTQVAAGKLGGPGGLGELSAGAKLAPGPSVLTLTLDVAGNPEVYSLSRVSHTVWQWRSKAPAAGTLPAGWRCPPGLPARSCAAEPMMTLRYTIGNLGLDGTAPAGPQSVALTVGHLQLARAAAVTGATVSVSFDGGRTWHRATVTGGNGSFRAVFTAPAGARVTLRTHATDAAGGSITETITGAYRTAS